MFYITVFRKSIQRFGLWKACVFLYDLAFWKFFKNRKSAVKYKTVGVDGDSFRVTYRRNTSDMAVISEVLLMGEYEWETEFNPDLIIDCGANIGIFSLLQSVRYPKTKIIAVEPENGNFDILKRNADSHNNILCIKGGVWFKDAFLKVEDTGHNEWGYTVRECEKDAYDIQGFSLGNLIDNQIKDVGGHCIYVKMDIEGSEKYIFEDTNLADWLSMIHYFVIEVHEDFIPGITGIIFDRMSENGFEILKKHDDTLFFKRKRNI